MHPQQQHMARFACTTMIAGRKATRDGSVLVAHSDDDVSDERVIYVPAREFAADTRRNVYYDDASLGPDPSYNATVLRRYIGHDRGPGYEPIAGEPFPASKPLGSVPWYDPDYPISHWNRQGEHFRTYAYFDSSYGIMNERGLVFGECTCGAKVQPKPDPGRRVFYSAELSRMALELCDNAPDAIRLMGHLIGRYGYYGTGETLLVGDRTQAWVMEMCGYDEQGGDGLWVAKRVPDEHYFVAANEFRIRDVAQGADPGDMLYSPNLFEVCRRLGLWNPDAGPLDWLPTVSWGEYSHPYYSLRRVWRAMSLAAPSLHLSPWVEDGYTRDYPFSVKPDDPLSVEALARIYRDHYEGTEFDLTRGPAAGPFGSPVRYEKNPDQGDTFNLNHYHPEGAWERPLSIYRCGMLWINQAREGAPDGMQGISWIGLDRPASNCLMPFFCGATELPQKMQTMILTRFDRAASAWWAFNYIANYATIKYSYMIEDIRRLQGSLESAARAGVAALEADPAGTDVPRRLDEFQRTNMEEVLARWWALADQLVVKYNDGCLTDPEAGKIMSQLGYPRHWLAQVGFFDGPIGYGKPPDAKRRA